jgi:anhydro-N-acetylmuramic acid kinase
MIVLGLSSGTSVDGIDVAAADLRLDGTGIAMTPLGHRDVAYSADLRTMILDALPPATTTLDAVCRIDTALGQQFAAAAVVAVADLCGGAADLIVSHGQTLYHWVEPGAAQRAAGGGGLQARGSLQAGQPAWIAEATGLPVVSDLRARDIAAGGHGAPLASTLDVLLLGDRPVPIAALNLGGMANVTVVRPGAPPLAFDTGPGNALIDAAARLVSGGHDDRDHDGRRAARGSVDGSLLALLLADPYYDMDPPKSTGREVFHRGYLEHALRRCGTGGDDLLATVTALTARTVADACRRHGVVEVVASGGGTHNPTLMAALRAALAPTRLTTSQRWGLPADAKEALLFALLGFLTWNGLAATVPSCTGARHATLAGHITPGSGPLRLPAPAGVIPTRLRIAPPGGARERGDRRPPGARGRAVRRSDEDTP